jgi:hypothetical protein
MTNQFPPIPEHTYNQYDFDITDILSMNNRLLCTFTSFDDMDILISDIKRKYDILYNKIYLIHVKSNNEYAITYNIDQGNNNSIPENTIMVHIKKEKNTIWRPTVSFGDPKVGRDPPVESHCFRAVFLGDLFGGPSNYFFV